MCVPAHSVQHARAIIWEPTFITVQDLWTPALKWDLASKRHSRYSRQYGIPLRKTSEVQSKCLEMFKKSNSFVTQFASVEHHNPHRPLLYSFSILSGHPNYTVSLKNVHVLNFYLNFHPLISFFLYLSLSLTYFIFLLLVLSHICCLSILWLNMLYKYVL